MPTRKRASIHPRIMRQGCQGVRPKDDAEARSLLDNSEPGPRFRFVAALFLNRGENGG